MDSAQEQFHVSRFALNRVALFPLAMWLLQTLAFWAVWRWLALRVWSSPEERWSFLALAAAIFFAFFWAQSDSIAGEPDADKSNFGFLNSGYLLSILFTLFYAASFVFAAPPLARAIVAMAALTFTLSRWRFGKNFHLGLYALLLLSLPSIASLQFFIGYPLRVAVGEATARLLQMQGLDVWREGVCLHFGEKLIWIDAPCSGVKMLWFGLFLTAFLVCFYRLSNLKTLLLFASAFLIILSGNVFRASALFYIEAEIVNAPSFMHEATGVFAFVFIALGIVSVCRFWRNFRKFGFERERSNLRLEINAPKIYTVFFLAACAAAFSAPLLFSKEKTVNIAAQNFRGFPATFEGFALKELPLSEREKFFLEDFPGSVGRFSDGRREIIIRSVREATRKLHPATDCFRAIGYETKPLPLKIGGDGKRWSCFSAVKAAEELKICERIFDDNGREWTDVSAWYWRALNESGVEWWAITTAERK